MTHFNSPLNPSGIDKISFVLDGAMNIRDPANSQLLHSNYYNILKETLSAFITSNANYSEIEKGMLFIKAHKGGKVFNAIASCKTPAGYKFNCCFEPRYANWHIKIELNPNHFKDFQEFNAFMTLFSPDWLHAPINRLDFCVDVQYELEAIADNLDIKRLQKEGTYYAEFSKKKKETLIYGSGNPIKIRIYDKVAERKAKKRIEELGKIDILTRIELEHKRPVKLIEGYKELQKQYEMRLKLIKKHADAPIMPVRPTITFHYLLQHYLQLNPFEYISWTPDQLKLSPDTDNIYWSYIAKKEILGHRRALNSFSKYHKTKIKQWLSSEVATSEIAKIDLTENWQNIFQHWLSLKPLDVKEGDKNE